MSILLKTPSANGTPFNFHVDEDTKQIVITSQHGNQFRYDLSAIRNLYLWLREEKKNEWVLLGTKNEQETPVAGTVEAWARSTGPVDGFYGLTQGNRGRFASFIPPILEYMGLAKVEHNVANNRMRAL